MKFLNKLLLSVSLWTSLLLFPRTVRAVESTMEAQVTWIIEERYPYQKLKFLVLSGPEKGQEVIYEHGTLPMTVIQTYKIGDRIILGKSQSETGETSYYIVDIVRRRSLYVLTAIFVGIVLIVARLQALRALIALVVSFGVVFMFVLPQILLGKDPVLVAMLASLLIIPVTFYLSHGFFKKTHIAVIGTLAALLMTSILARVFVAEAALTGFASEEATFLQAMRGSQINIKGLLLAGVIIGILGILDDVTVSQAAIVAELAEANRNLTRMELFRKAMRVGTDHISSMINTLVLVYAGASMPLLLLFLDSPKPVTELINYEIVAEEIVRTLVGSIGLVLAVPLTTLLAVRLYQTAKREGV